MGITQNNETKPRQIIVQRSSKVYPKTMLKHGDGSYHATSYFSKAGTGTLVEIERESWITPIYFGTKPEGLSYSAEEYEAYLNQSSTMTTQSRNPSQQKKVVFFKQLIPTQSGEFCARKSGIKLSKKIIFFFFTFK